MIILTTAVLVYIASIYGCYKYIQKSHYHEDGQYNIIEPDSVDIFMMLFPLVNSWFSIEYMLGLWRRSEKRAVNFFKPKNK
jgi:hypothetical protein